MVVLVTCKNEEDPIQKGGARVLKIFPIITLWELSDANGNQISDLFWPKTLCSLSTIPIMLQMKLDFD